MCVRSPRTFFRIVGEISRELGKIRKADLDRAIGSLYHSKLIDARDHSDGSTTLVLSENGKQEVLTYKLDAISIQRPKVWDRRWRVILFDVPEERKKIRDALRFHFKRLGCYQLQKSVFVHPFECKKEIDFIVEFHQARPFVRFMTANEIDVAPHLRRAFSI